MYIEKKDQGSRFRLNKSLATIDFIPQEITDKMDFSTEKVSAIFNSWCNSMFRVSKRISSCCCCFFFLDIKIEYSIAKSFFLNTKFLKLLKIYGLAKICIWNFLFVSLLKWLRSTQQYMFKRKSILKGTLTHIWKFHYVLGSI